MKRLITVCSLTIAVVLAMGSGSSARADWDPGQPAKWAQLPDLTPFGVDVMASYPKVLADDFLCTSTGVITDVHIWGSWKYDLFPPDGPANVSFMLGIYSDIPAGPTGNYSMPGQLLWQKYFMPGDFGVRLYADVAQGEGWYNPNTGEFIHPGDFLVWQYNFYIDEVEAFRQTGTKENPVVYWLSVQAMPMGEPGTMMPQFGWKTSQEHWNDDAVWSDHGYGWQELRYPPQHPLYGQSMDLAFVITPEPTTIAILGLGLLGFRSRRK